MFNLQTESGSDRAYLALPESGRGPGVLVLHAWWGLTPVFTGLCDRLAREGFVALAPDLSNGLTASTVAEAEANLAARDVPRSRAAAHAAVQALRDHPAVQSAGLGSIGFSMGAAWALQLASDFPQAFSASVLFYGVGPSDVGPARTAFQGHFAETDEWEPLEGVREMEAALRAAGREVDFYVYPGTGHWFFESDRPDAYQPEAAELAWERALSYLRSHL